MKLLRQHRRSGAALIIVLAFVVLLLVLALAYFSRTVTDRQVAQSSFRQTNADQLALSAIDVIVADLEQEIVNGSTTSTVNGVTIYTPSSSPNMLPMRSPAPAAGTTPAIPNLIRRSVRSDGIPSPAPNSRASGANSTVDVSVNGRSISFARWNSHYLVPKSNPGDDKSDPITPTTTGFTAPNSWAPDWVFVTNVGPKVIPSPTPSVIGRYAYAIYDEGGLLDINVAGYPTGTSIYQYGRKGSLAFADLTALPSPTPASNPVPSPIFNGPSPSPYQVDFIVGWRNYGTSQPSNSFPSSSPAFAGNFQTSTASAAYFYNFVVNNTSGFLTARNDSSPSPTPTPTPPYPWNYLNVTGNPSPSPYPWNGRTDQMFLGRQELIALQKTTQFSANALQYLGTFSREAAAAVPQWTGPSPTPTSINPNFQTLLVTGSFTRNDGTTANVGDPLVNKRFLLQRLNWLTYKGPSATRTLSDPDMSILTSRFGLTSAFLLQGTAANITKYFGLAWDSANERWNYVGHGGGSSPISSIATFGPGGTQAATRDPDFFELLQAGILDISIAAGSFSPDSALPIVHQQSKMLHLLTIGANLIAQSRADCYPVRVACSVSVSGTPTVMEAVGAPRLPYLSSLAACPVAGTGATGGVNWFLIPNLWDPFRDTWDLTEANVSSTLTPAYPRPPVQITVKGTGAPGGNSASVGFGAATVSASGSVKSGVTTLTTLSGINSSLTLTTGATTGNAFGRDGLREALRLGISDISGTVTLFDPPTQSPPGTSPSYAWNMIIPPTSDGSPYRTDNFVVLRLSLPASGITGGSTAGKNPVLILNAGFQITMDYQSPITPTKWYSYSFLQGNNATNTWISSANLNLATSFSQYRLSPAPPTIVNSGTSTATPWAITTLAAAPMFAKGDPRSIRYNSQIGVVNLKSPPMSFASAGVIGSIWPDSRAAPPNTYATPPPMFTIASPGPTPTPNPNPSTYSQAGDNGPAASDPYDEYIPTGQTNSIGDAVRPIVMNRPFRSVGEMAYAFRDEPFKTLSFSSGSSSNPSPDAGLLDLFSVNDYSNPSSMRAGVISANSRQSGAITAVLGSTIKREDTPRSGSTPSPAPLALTSMEANSAGTSLASSTTPVMNKAGLATLIANETGLGPTAPKTQRESIARALGEADQTRTWNLLIDVIAQSGRYKPNPTSLQNDFIVEGEQRYWVHVAIDRFTGQVIDKQVEAVKQ